MTDKAKASEHDLREGSKPRCPKCGYSGHLLHYEPYYHPKNLAIGVKVWCENCPENTPDIYCSSLADFAQFFPIAAIPKGSKPEVNEHLEQIRWRLEKAKELYTLSSLLQWYEHDIAWLLSQLAAILEENQRLKGIFCEAHGLEDCKSCPCCEAVHQDDLRKAAEAENQRLAKDLADSDKEDDENYAGYLREVKAREAAEAKLGKMREELLKAAEDVCGMDAGPFMQPYFEKLRKAVERWK